MRDLQDRVIVITGASSGIGAVLAEHVHQRGGKPVLAARREAELRDVSARCGNALYVVTDVTHRDQQQRLLQATLDRHGHVDAWVANAGVGMSRLPSQLTDADVDQMMALNVKPAIAGAQIVLPHFQQRGRGHLVFVSSMLGRVPFAPIRAAYAGSKAYLDIWVASLRVELRKAWPDIHVSLFSPGVVATDFGLNAVHGGPDNRQLPGAQPVEEVAQGLADLLAHPQADVYSRPQARAMVAAYYAAEDMAAMEAGWGR